MEPLKKNATYDDLLEVPDRFVAEMYDGDLYAFPRPALPHARAKTVLSADLMGPFDQGRNGPGGWVILERRAQGPRDGPRRAVRRDRARSRLALDLTAVRFATETTGVSGARCR